MKHSTAISAFLVGAFLLFTGTTVYAQIVPAQNQVSTGPYGGVVLSTTTSPTGKLNQILGSAFGDLLYWTGTRWNTTSTSSLKVAGTPGGLNTQVQYNNAGVFGGITGATTDGTVLSLTNALLGGATLTTSSVNGVILTTGGSATAFLNGAGAYTVPAGTIYTSTYPIQISGTVISTAFGTTSSNTFAGTQTFTSPIVVSNFTGTVNANNGTLYATATSTPTLTSPITYSGTLGSFIGGVSGAFGCVTCETGANVIATTSGIAISQLPYYTKVSGVTTLGGIATTSPTINNGLTGTLTTINSQTQTIGLASIANGTALAFVGSGTGVPVATATSTWFGTGIGGQLLTWNNGVPQWVASTTYTAPLSFSAGAVSCATCATFAYPWSNLVAFATNTAATTTVGWYKTGLFASSTSQFDNSTTTLATFAQGPWITSLTSSGLGIDANHRIYAAATSTLSTISGTLALSQLAAQNANTVVANATGGSAAPTAVATSTFFGTGTGGQVLMWSNVTNGPVWFATSSSGGGNAASKWATSTTDLAAISPAGALKVGIGTTTFLGNSGTLTLASSTVSAPLLSLSGGPTVPGIAFFNQSGNLYLATTSDLTGATTSMSTFLAVGGAAGMQGIMFGLGATVPTDNTFANFFFRDQNGLGPALTLGGNSGGDNSWVFRRFADNDGNADDRLSIGTGDQGASMAELLTLFPSGLTGVGTTTPWGLFSIGSTTLNQATTPYFSIGTSSTGGTGADLVDVFATTSTLSSNVSLISGATSILDSGVRFVIGAFQKYQGPLLDQLNVNGRINTGEWFLHQCDSSGFASTLSAAATNPCDGWAYRVDGVGGAGPTSSNANSIIGGININTGVSAANSGNGFFALSGASTGSIRAATTSVSLEFPITNGNNSFAPGFPIATSTIYGGFVNISGGGTSLEVPPTQGCYITASSSAPTGNWFGVCQGSAGTVSMQDLQIPSTTPYFIRFRIDMDATGAYFRVATPTTTMSLIMSVTNSNAPTTTLLSAAVYEGRVTAGQNSSGFFVNWMRLWYRKNMWPN